MSYSALHIDALERNKMMISINHLAAFFLSEFNCASCPIYSSGAFGSLETNVHMQRHGCANQVHSTTEPELNL